MKKKSLVKKAGKKNHKKKNVVKCYEDVYPMKKPDSFTLSDK